jgi:hypothetical protein
MANLAEGTMNKTATTGGKLHPSQKFVPGRVHRRQIKNAPYNPRQIDEHARKKLFNKLKTRGLLASLTWNKRTGNLLSGHQRLSILDDLSKTGDDYTLDMDVVDLSEKEEKEENVFFNNPSAQGTFEVDKLGTMIANDEIDYRKAGFDDMDLQMTFEGTEYAVTMFDEDGAPSSVQDDLDQLEEIQRMKRERKAHRERDQEANDPEFYSVVVFPNREAQGRFMERVGMSRNDRYVDGVRLHTSLEATKARTKSYDGELFEEMTFWLASDQKKVVDDELTRLAALMSGKNLRGRALEAMAVISSQTPTNNITGDEPEEPAPAFKPRKRKKRRTDA